MSRAFDKLLIANRGEIACRIMRTAKRMGLATVAVYLAMPIAMRCTWRSPTRRCASARRPRGTAICNIAAIIAAARETARRGGASRLRLSLRERRVRAGLRRRGPDLRRAVGGGHPPDGIEARRRRRCMEAAGVPIVPGYHGADQSAAAMRDAAERIGYPVLIKASAGGGGRGMRRVEAAGEIDDALASATREAQAAFGDDTLLLEKYIARRATSRSRSSATRHGNVVILLERECSLQRRHQKVVEEAPSTGLMTELRARRDVGRRARAARGRRLCQRGHGRVHRRWRSASISSR